MVHGDNRGVIEGWWNRRSQNRATNEVSSNSMNLPGPSWLNPPSTWFMSGASSTLQMHPVEGSSHLNPFSFHQYSSQQNLTISLLTHKHPSHRLNCEIAEESITPGQHKEGTMMLTRSLTTTCDDALGISENNITNLIHDSSSKFNQSLLADTLTKGVRPNAYHTGLAPWPSNLRPHCLAWDRLWLWQPLSSRSNTISDVAVSDSDLERILDMINLMGQRD